jgi:ABC-2 type transport system permease protein
MTSHARAILWAQWRSQLNYYPKVNKAGLAFSGILASVWYGGWLFAASFIAYLIAQPKNVELIRTGLPSGLLFVFVYWQIIPILLVSTGVSLSTKKLQVYPIPHSQLFLLEVLLRLSTSIEMVLILAGLSAGVLANPRLPKWSVPAVLIFAVFNLCFAAGAREMMMRIFERKRFREVGVLMVVMLGAIPQLLVTTGAQKHLEALLRSPTLPIWPWSATALLTAGQASLFSIVSLATWTVGAYRFGRWQFERSLRFDADESNATKVAKSSRDVGIFYRFLRWPALLFPDPLAALIEKEMRFLLRAPRFRLVFAMGFTFGLVIWLPMALGRGQSSMFGQHYLTFTCVYALILLGDVCFWNAFGFDRAAAQVYWAMPVRFSTVLASKNITALFFVLLEITSIASVCALIRMPVTVSRVLEAFAVTLVVSLYLISLGNLTSTSNARPMNPAKAMRSGSPGRMQALLFLLYPIAAAPVLLAYAARYAFDSEAAFFIVLGISALIGGAVYWVSLESAVAAAHRNKEKLLAVLAQGEGVMQA